MPSPLQLAAIQERPFYPTDLGEKCLLMLDANFLPTVELSGSLANSWWSRKLDQDRFAQSVSGFKPSYGNPTTANQISMLFDGTDDYMALTGLGSLPTGANTLNIDIMALERNATTAATTPGQAIIAWGSGSGTAVRLQRSAASGLNRRQLSVGNGSAQVAAVITNAPTNAKCFTHGRIVPGTIGIRFNREAEVTAALVHSVSGGNAVLGAFETALSGYWNGPINCLSVFSELTEDERTRAREWFLLRGGL